MGNGGISQSLRAFFIFAGQERTTESGRMPTMRTILMLPAILMLAACAGNHPDNVPQYGQWEIVNRIDSLTIDGIVIPPEQLPAKFKRFDATESRCGEPMFVDSEWQQDELGRRSGGQCRMESYVFDAAKAEGDGRCELEDSEPPFAPKFTLRGKFDADSYRKVVTMDGSIVLPQDNSPHTLRLIVVQEGTRTGEC